MPCSAMPCHVLPSYQSSYDRLFIPAYARRCPSMSAYALWKVNVPACCLVTSAPVPVPVPVPDLLLLLLLFVSTRGQAGDIKSINL